MKGLNKFNRTIKKIIDEFSEWYFREGAPLYGKDVPSLYTKINELKKLFNNKYNIEVSFFITPKENGMYCISTFQFNYKNEKLNLKYEFKMIDKSE